MNILINLRYKYIDDIIFMVKLFLNCQDIKGKYFVVFAMMLMAFTINGAVKDLLPVAKKVNIVEGLSFRINRPVEIGDETDSNELKIFMSEAGLLCADSAVAKIIVNLSEVNDAYNYPLYGYEEEAYRLSVSKDTILIQAPTPTGVIRAAQTLRQMLLGNEGEIEGVEIIDWPSFKLRGFMHDVGRSFLPFEELKREIDLLSRFKVNTFHWHLTDNTGWRLEIDAYPQLTGPKAITRYPGEFYTKEQARELQNFAAERGMIIIPEIDIPGHSGPFDRAMGFSMQSEEGVQSLKKILSEVADIFDKSPYIHIGGDEIPFPDEYLINMIDYVHSLGKKVVLWNRYNRPPKIVDPEVIPCDMTTNWATSGTLSKGVPNIDMRYNYTNHFDVFADLVGIYKSNIFNRLQGDEDVAGTISAAWNDTKTPTYNDIIVQNNIYANILASAERAWKGGGNQYIETGGTTLPVSGSEFDEFADWERRFLFHKATTLAETSDLIPYVSQSNISWCITDQMPNGGDQTAVLLPEKYISSDSMPEMFVINDVKYGVNNAVGGGIYLKHIWHPVVKGFYDNPLDSVTSYAWTYVYSPVDQDAGALIEFYTYSRSGDDKAPETGCWDRRGSKIWLNGKELSAPKWDQPNADIKQDQIDSGLTNENFTNRVPVKIRLKKGWNKIFLKLPHVNSGGTKRDKWQFTFVITDLDGRNALDGLIYSPKREIID